ncbi:Uncharacterised protein [Mycobacteroides abscessus subsp. abscessus]|nr:Uncharacterised protein [Mycobacteroides abscessus subsp. abscessus]
MKHFSQWIVRFTGFPFLTIVLNGNLFVADPSDHPAYIWVLFIHLLENIDNTPIHQTEVAGIDRNVDASDSLE